MAKVYYSTEADRKILLDTVRRVRGGNGSQRNAPRRPRYLGGTPVGRIVYALVNEVSGVSSGDPTFDFDNAHPVVGSIPTGGNGTAQNQYAQTYANNDPVLLFYDEDADQWLTERGGTSGSQVIYAELTENKAYADVAKLAQPVDAAGALDSGASDFYLIDHEARYYGRAAFNDTANGGGSVNGYRYAAVRITDDYASSGKPGFRIIDGEDPDDFILVQIQSLTTGSEYACTYANEFPGGPDSARRPQFTAASSGIAVFDDLAIVDDFTAGDYWVAKWFKSSAHYTLWRPVQPVAAPAGTRLYLVTTEIPGSTTDPEGGPGSTPLFTAAPGEGIVLTFTGDTSGGPPTYTWTWDWEDTPVLLFNSVSTPIEVGMIVQQKLVIAEEDVLLIFVDVVDCSALPVEFPA